MCSIDDAEPWAFYRSAHLIARKAHRCDECGRTIDPGERYLRAVGKAEGDLSTLKTCAHGEAAGKWLAIVCGGWPSEGLAEDLCDHWDDSFHVIYKDGTRTSIEYRSFWLGRAVAGIGRQWRRRDGSLLPVLGPPPIDSDGRRVRSTSEVGVSQ